jgi:hypothetical protein
MKKESVERIILIRKQGMKSKRKKGEKLKK